MSNIAVCMAKHVDPLQMPPSVVTHLDVQGLHKPISPNTTIFNMCHSVCTSDEKRLTNLMNISLFFSLYMVKKKWGRELVDDKEETGKDKGKQK